MKKPTLTPRQRKILSILGQDGLTLSEIMEHMPSDVTTRSLNSSIRHMEKMGMLTKESKKKIFALDRTVWKKL